MTIGALGAGAMGDRMGRRLSYQINLLIFGLASLVGAFAPSIDWLIAFHVLMGIGIGAEVVCGYVMIGEFMPPTERGQWAAGLTIITNSALFVCNVVAVYVIPNLGWPTCSHRRRGFVGGVGHAADDAAITALAGKPGPLRRGGRGADAHRNRSVASP